MDPSIQAVIWLICWRGLLVLVPVVGSYAERDNGITCVPVPLGSKDGSPVGTGTLNTSAGLALPVRSRSWSRNCPQIYRYAVRLRLFGVSTAGWATRASLIARALGRSAPAGLEMPSAYWAGAMRS